MAPCPWSAVRKTFASGREGPREDLASTAAELRFEPFQVGVEDFLETMPGCVGPRRSEVLERLDSPAPTFLVVPEIQVGPPANLFRRHATADLHAPGIGATLFKVDGRPFPRGHAHPFVSGGNPYGGPTPGPDRWTSSSSPSTRRRTRSAPFWPRP